MGLAENNGEKKEEEKKKREHVSLIPLPLLYFLALLLSAASAVLLTHLFVPSPIRPIHYSLAAPSSLPRPLRPSFLSHLLEDRVYGAYALAVDEKSGHFFVGLRTGIIAEIAVNNDGQARIVRGLRLTSSEGCDGSYASFPRCGRPLGLRFSPSGTLLIADAYLGIFEVDLAKEKVYTLVRGGALLEGGPSDAPPLRFAADVDVLPDGRLVIVETSTRFDHRDAALDFMEARPNGRVLLFDPSNEKLSLLAGDLFHPTSLQVVYNAIIVSESGRQRLLKLALAHRAFFERLMPHSHKWEEAEGESGVFVDGLPGPLGLIRQSMTGDGFWLAIPATFSSFDGWLAERPTVRTLLAKVLSRQMLHSVLVYLREPSTMALKIDAFTGGVLEVLSDEDGAPSLSLASCVVETAQRTILLGNEEDFHIVQLKIN